MNVTCLFLEPDGGMRLEGEPVAVAAWQAGGGPYWIDPEGGSREAVTAWLAGLGLDPAMFDLPGTGDDDARIVPLAESLFFSYPVVTGEDLRTPAYSGVLCLDRLVITMHEQASGPSGLTGISATRFKLREGTTAGVVCALVLLHATRMRQRVVRLRREASLLVDRMDSDPVAVSLEEILTLKRGVLALGGVVDEKLAVLEILRGIDTPALSLGHLAEPLQTAVEMTRAPIATSTGWIAA